SPRRLRSLLSSLHAPSSLSFYFFFFTPSSSSGFYTLSLHDALPIWVSLCLLKLSNSFNSVAFFGSGSVTLVNRTAYVFTVDFPRSEEHTSELQSRFDLVCRLLLEKKKKKQMHKGV